MLALIKEKLQAALDSLKTVSGLYLSEPYRFPAAYVDWLQQTSKEIEGLRDPLIGVLQSEQAKVAAVSDGLIPVEITANKSLRKTQRAAAAQSMGVVSQLLFERLTVAEQQMDDYRDKISQAIAALAIRKPDSLELLEVDYAGRVKIWRALQEVPETQPVYHYLSSRLTLSDRDYLINEVLFNYLENNRVVSATALEQIKQRLEQQQAEVGKDWAELAQLKNLKRVRCELTHDTSLSDEQAHSLLVVAQLQQLEGCGLAWAYLLSLSGVDTLKELATRNPENLHQRLLHEAEQQGVFVDELVDLTVISNWTAQVES